QRCQISLQFDWKGTVRTLRSKDMTQNSLDTRVATKGQPSSSTDFGQLIATGTDLITAAKAAAITARA
ncbi:hypothetical protein, partial [Staphylococcus aureus]